MNTINVKGVALIEFCDSYESRDPLVLGDSCIDLIIIRRACL